MDETKESFYQKLPVVLLGTVVCCFLWGSAFPCIKICYKIFAISSEDIGTQIFIAGIRFTLAGILAIIMGSVAAKKWIRPKKESWGKVLKLSSFQTVGQYALFYIGLSHTTGVRSSIVEGTNVFIAIFVAAVIFHQEKLTGRKIIGSIIGFAGVVLISLTGSIGNDAAYLIGDALVILSTVCYAMSSVFLKRYAKEESTVVLSGYQFLVGGIIMIALGLALGGKTELFAVRGIMLLVYLAFVSAAAYTIWGILLSHNPISRVAVFGFLTPMFGVILSAIFLHESDSLSGTSVIALVLICLGIYVVNAEKKSSNDGNL